MPLGMLRILTHVSSIGGLPPDVAIALATGNNARVHRVEGGLIALGEVGDIVLADAPIGSIADTALDAISNGDLPGISMVLIDGVPLIGRSRNTPPAKRMAAVERGSAPGGAGH